MAISSFDLSEHMWHIMTYSLGVFKKDALKNDVLEDLFKYLLLRVFIPVLKVSY